jgi:hypothetical protein
MARLQHVSKCLCSHLPLQRGMVFFNLDGSGHLDSAGEFHANADVAILPADGLEFHLRHPGRAGWSDRPDWLCTLCPHGPQGLEVRQVLFSRAVGASVYVHQRPIVRSPYTSLRRWGSFSISGLFYAETEFRPLKAQSIVLKCDLLYTTNNSRPASMEGWI